MAVVGSVLLEALVKVVDVPATFHPALLLVWSLGVKTPVMVAVWSLPFSVTLGKATAEGAVRASAPRPRPRGWLARECQVR